jgi:hypothetical protein
MKRNKHSARQGYSAHSYMLALEKGLLPFYHHGLFFQQDNARIHTAHNTRLWFINAGVITIS